MMRPLVFMVLCALSSPGLVGQDRASDRRRFLDPGTATSDDPRRVPAAPGPRGPEGAIVFRGGRIFDGTGAPARVGTLVIERTRITRVLPPSSTEAPPSYLTELRQFVAAGFSVPEALGAATRVGAELLDMDEKLGTLVPGKLADVLVVEGRPDERLDDLLRVDLVIRDGEVVVEKGRLATPQHVPVPEPTPRPAEAGRP